MSTKEHELEQTIVQLSNQVAWMRTNIEAARVTNSFNEMSTHLTRALMGARASASLLAPVTDAELTIATQREVIGAALAKAEKADFELTQHQACDRAEAEGRAARRKGLPFDACDYQTEARTTGVHKPELVELGQAWQEGWLAQERDLLVADILNEAKPYTKAEGQGTNALTRAFAALALHDANY